jgi:hypothetical protein
MDVGGAGSAFAMIERVRLIYIDRTGWQAGCPAGWLPARCQSGLHLSRAGGGRADCVWLRLIWRQPGTFVTRLKILLDRYHSQFPSHIKHAVPLYSLSYNRRKTALYSLSYSEGYF